MSGLYRALRPLLFAWPAPTAHALGNAALWPVEHLGPFRALTKRAFALDDARLASRRMGLRFPNPVGLAGGFDKNASRPRALAALGFGFLELGTMTALPQAPNPPPNLFRLPADEALINRLGFPNLGAAAVAATFERAGGRDAVGVPVFFSIGKSRAVDAEDRRAVLDDYRASYRHVRQVADAIVVNVSSPNTKGLRSLQGAEVARVLLSTLREEAERAPGATRVPLLIKVAPDLENDELDALLAVVIEVGLDGVIATNTTLSREGLATDPATVAAIGAGGLSGKPLRARSPAIVRRVRERLGDGPTVIGVGGIATADHALAMLQAGADLVQLYTGFIYEGPGAPRAICEGLLSALRARGLDDLEALGSKLRAERAAQ
jgi:dihydroorotate dehydrogenase